MDSRRQLGNERQWEGKETKQEEGITAFEISWFKSFGRGTFSMLFITGYFFCSGIVEAWLSLICYEHFCCFSPQSGPQDVRALLLFWTLRPVL